VKNLLGKQIDIDNLELVDVTFVCPTCGFEISSKYPVGGRGFPDSEFAFCPKCEKRRIFRRIDKDG